MGYFLDELKIRQPGFPDLLRYSSMISRHVVLGKGGELISSFRYRGPDMQCASDGALTFLRERANDVVRRLDAGWMLHVTTFREESVVYTGGGYFPGPVSRAIERERQAQYEAEGAHYDNEYFITFTYLPEPLLVNRAKEFAFDSEEKGRMNPRRIAEKSVKYFEQKLDEYRGDLEMALESRMERLGAKRYLDKDSRRRMWKDTHLSFLHRCLTGLNQPIRLPDGVIPMGVDFLIGSYAFSGGVQPILNGEYIRAVAIEGLPDSGTHLGILEVLNRLGVQYRWTSRWVAGDPEIQKKKVRRTRSMWRQKIRGFVADMRGNTTGPVNENAVDMAKDAEGVLKDLESKDCAYGEWSSVVILRGKNPGDLEAAATFLSKMVRAKGFPVRDEDINTIEAFLGSLPGHGYENLRRPEIHSFNLADCLPLTSIWQGPQENPCSFYKNLYPEGALVPPLFQGSTTGGAPFRGVLHVGDVGHTFIGGPTGAGKSTLLGLIASSHFRYPRARFYGFEKGESMLALCLGDGGTHYNFMDEKSDRQIGLAPLRNIQRWQDRIWAVDYVSTILELNGVDVDLDVGKQLRSAMDLLASRPAHMRNFTVLASLVQMPKVRDVLRLYESQMAGGMLNAEEDSISTGRFTVFEMEKLMEMDDKHVVPVLLYLFRMIERSLDGSPTIICLDEAWLMLKHPMFAAKIKEWLKVLRKANCYVIFATQEIEDLSEPPIASTIFSACQTKILLPNKDALRPESQEVYRGIGLSQREIELLAGAIPKREYLFINPYGRRLFQLELGPVALSFVGVSGAEERETIKELQRIHGGEWIIHWAKKQDLDPGVFKGGAVDDAPPIMARA